MHFLLNLILTVLLIFGGSAVLFTAWRWALENFNLGHIQLQDLTSRSGYQEAPGHDDVEAQRSSNSDGYSDIS